MKKRRDESLLIAAASSLTDIVPQLSAAYARASHAPLPRATFAASGTLAAQIRAGAPIDVFLCAGKGDIDRLRDVGRIDGSARPFAGNRLALIVPTRPRPGGLSLRSFADLVKASRIALGNPESVPAGRFARATLEKRGLWATVEKRLVYGTSVRQTMAYVAAGDVDAGFVFATDARSERRVKAIATATSGVDHDPILYYAAAVAVAPHTASARGFVLFLATSAAQKALLGAGFLKP